MDIILNTQYDQGSDELEKAPSVVPFFQNLLNSINPDFSSAVIPLLAHYHGLEGRWVGVTPIHWQATHNDSMIVACGDSLNLSEKNSRAYLEQLNIFLQEDTSQFHYHNPSLWLMNIDNKPELHSLPPEKVLHRSLMPILETWDKTLYWVRLFTELQMLFASPGLQHSESMDLPVNGVWLWGDAPLNPTKSRLISNDHQLVKNLSTYVNTELLDVNSFQPLTDCTLALNPVEEPYLNLLEPFLIKHHCKYIYNNQVVIKKPMPWAKRLWRKLR